MTWEPKNKLDDEDVDVSDDDDKDDDKGNLAVPEICRNPLEISRKSARSPPEIHRNSTGNLPDNT